MHRVSIARPTERRAVMLSNESTFAMKHLNRVSVKAKMGKKKLNTQKNEMLRISAFTGLVDLVALTNK